jgi:hypothetical protein
MVALSALPMNIAQQVKEASTFLPDNSEEHYKITLLSSAQRFSSAACEQNSIARVHP